MRNEESDFVGSALANWLDVFWFLFDFCVTSVVMSCSIIRPRGRHIGEPLSARRESLYIILPNQM